MPSPARTIITGSDVTVNSASIVPVNSHRSIVDVVVSYSSSLVKLCPHSGQVGVSSSGIATAIRVLSLLL